VSPYRRTSYREKPDDRFFPCNARERDIISRLSGLRDNGRALADYIAARHAGATVSQAEEAATGRDS